MWAWAMNASIESINVSRNFSKIYSLFQGGKPPYYDREYRRQGIRIIPPMLISCFFPYT